MTKKVNESNTKKEILEAYGEVLGKLQQYEGSKLDPQREVAEKKAAETLTKAGQTAGTSVEDQIASLQKNIAGVLGNLSNSLSEEIKKFQNIQEAIVLKEAELKELFGIEKEAFALAALINTQKQMREDFALEDSQKRANLNQAIIDLNNQMAELRKNTQEELARLKAEAKQARDREQAEYEYEFSRRKMKEENDLQDQLDARRKEFNEELEETEKEIEERVEELDKREADLEKREEKLDSLEAEVEAFPAREAQIRKEVEEQVRKDEARTMAIKESYIKKDFESQKSVLENQVSMLKDSLTAEQAKVSELQDKLDKAYEKIQGMALASVQGANDSKILDKFANALDKSQK